MTHTTRDEAASTTASSPAPRSASYGIDAPTLLPIAAAFSLVNVGLAVASGRVGPLVAALAVLMCIAFGLHSSLRGKFMVWETVLDGLKLGGDERLLDLGCGRGAVLIAAARRLRSGRALGADVWSRTDQSGNSPVAARNNAVAEKVQERVALVTADMTALPLRSESFDVITSSIAIHNIKGVPRRLRAIDEAVRVLRPGGRVALADMRSAGAYADRLRALGMNDVTCRNLGWRMWWGGPWAPTRLVTATKPEPAKATTPRAAATPEARGLRSHT